MKNYTRDGGAEFMLNSKIWIMLGELVVLAIAAAGEIAAALSNTNPLYNGLKEVYRHTEATVYFDQVPPNGFSVPGPYNLSGKRVSCFVFLPSRLATEDNHQTYIRIFVKDTKFANDFSTAVNIDPSVTNRWIQLSFIVGAESGNADRSFDPTRVNAIGIRIETPDGSTMSYNGTFYIDDCSI